MGILNQAIMLGCSYAASYSISESSTSLNEGSTVTFTVTTVNVPNGTTLYWTTNTVSGTVNSSDFSDSATSGSFSISNGSGSVSRTLTNDTTTEGTESFQLQVRTGSTGGTIVATSNTVTINDTSLSPVSWPASIYMIGGGGGGARFNGGGGAGAYVIQNQTVETLTNYTITIGAGGARYNGQGQNGSSTQFRYPTGFILNSGGGGGGGQRGNGTSPSYASGAGSPSPMGSGVVPVHMILLLVLVVVLVDLMAIQVVQRLMELDGVVLVEVDLVVQDLLTQMVALVELEDLELLFLCN